MPERGVEVLTGRQRRRRWSIEEKLRLVAATYKPGACVRQVAAGNDIYPGLVFRWRRQVREGRLARPSTPTFLPVRASALPAVVELKASATKTRGLGKIEIELKDGSRVRIDAHVSLTSLRRIIAALRG
jgi:transposase